MRICTYISPLLIAFASFCSVAAPARDNITRATLLQHQSLAFIENLGQITDQNFKPRTDIQYKIQSGGINIFIGDGQLHYQWLKASPHPFPKERGLGIQHSITPPSKGRGEASFYRLDVSLIGANSNAQPFAEGMQPGTDNYTLPQLSAKTLIAHSYSKVTYKNVYPGIDWVLNITNNQLKYNFILHPGANVSDIQLRYDGATALSVNGDGSFTALTPMGTVTENAPISFETENGRPISSAFHLQGNILTFSLGAHSGIATIDPLLSWATYYGGSGGNDHVNGVACDSLGNVYIVGETISANNIATTGAHQGAYSGPAGYYDAYVAAFSKSGQRLWGSYFGDTASDYGNSIACDAYHHVYITGTTSSTQGIATAGAYQAALSGGLNPDAFLAKFDAVTGLAIWSTYYGGPATELGSGVACDSSGSVYITGSTLSTSGISTLNAYHPDNIGYYDAYLAKFDSSGGLTWGTYFGGESFDLGKAVTLDRYGNVYISGNTESTTYIHSSGAFQDHLIGNQDAFLAKFTNAGQIIWSTYFGGATTNGNAIACDSAANIFLGGESTNDTGITTTGSFQPVFTPGGFDEDYIIKFTATGQRIWGTYFGGSNTDYLNGMSADPAGNIWIAGSTASTDNIATQGAYQTNNTGFNAFFAKFRNDGALRYGSYFGGNSGYEAGSAIATDYAGNIYLGGVTGSDTGIATANGFQKTFFGPYCGFLAAFAGDTDVYISQPFTDTLFCSLGSTFNLPYGVMNNFHLTNIFTVQLSDSTGSFASPAAIAAVFDSLGGVINCTLPGTAHGNHYRIRVIGSQPADTSADDGLDIVISATPPAPDSSAGNSPICAGYTLSLTATDTSAGVTYRWTKPDSTFIYGQNPTIVNIGLADSGNYYVSAMLNGCPSVPDTVHVAVLPSPVKPSDSTNSPICATDTLFVSAYDSTAGITYHWTGPVGFSDTTQSFIIPGAQTVNTGSYIVTASLNTCNSIPDTVNVAVHQLVVPSAAIYVNPPGPISPGEMIALTTSITNGGTNPTLQWYKNNVAIPGATITPYYTTIFVNGDVVKLIVHSSDPCASPDSSVTTGTPLGVHNINNPGSIDIYPNPNNGTFTLSGAYTNGLEIEIQNVLGQIIYRDAASASKGLLRKNITLDNGLPSGIYFLHAYTSDNDEIIKFTLQH